MKKAIVLGCMVGAVTMVVSSASAMTTTPWGNLYTKNPIYSAPKGYAHTGGPKGPITAKCTVSKKGYTTKSVSASKNTSGSVDTDWVSGPTYESSGTTFKSKHTGYCQDGTYWTGTAKYEY